MSHVPRQLRLGIAVGLASLALLVSAITPALAARPSTPLTVAAGTSPAAVAHYPIVLTEMKIQTGWAFIAAGQVVFDISNLGKITHEVVVIRTTTAPDSLPVDPTDSQRVLETGSVGEADDIAPGANTSLALTLAPGHYVLICNDPGHYAAGMHAGFTAVTNVNATLTEMAITLDRPSVPYGPVLFSVTNAGAITHELVILKIGVNPEDVPLGADGRASEATDIGEVNDIAPHTFSGGVFDLTPGWYVLICNLPGHFGAGMRTRFQVTATPVVATLKEMSITLDQTTVPAGPVTFAVTNAGSLTHELVVIRTTAADGALPPGDEAGKVSEAGWVGETGDMAPGQFSGLTVYLAPGTYAIICNDPGHYTAGMHLILTVQ